MCVQSANLLCASSEFLSAFELTTALRFPVQGFSVFLVCHWNGSDWVLCMSVFSQVSHSRMAGTNGCIERSSKTRQILLPKQSVHSRSASMNFGAFTTTNAPTKRWATKHQEAFMLQARDYCRDTQRRTCTQFISKRDVSTMQATSAGIRAGSSSARSSAAKI